MRWRKVLRDVWLQRGRAALVVVAMSLGIFGVVWITSSSTVLSRELRAQYLATDPASVTILADGLDANAVADVRSMPGVAAAETASTVTGRVRVGASDYVPLRLFSRTQFTTSTIAKLTPETGTWPPPPGEIVIERAAMRVAETTVGETIEITVPGGEARQLRVAGTVHDLGQSPAWQDGLVYGYATPDTLAQLGFSARPTELRIVVAGDRFDRAGIDRVAVAAADLLRARGLQVTKIFAPPPGVHPHQSQMDSLLWLQRAFGALALMLSALLVATLMAALLAGQVRQIGSLKAVGARTGQIARSYAGMVTVLGILALAVGWPLGRLAAVGYIGVVSDILNFEASDGGLPGWVTAGQIAIGLAVPLLAAAIPVLRAARATAAEAMRDHGVSAPAKPSGAGLAGWLSRRRLPRLPLMAARNAFRRRGRVAVTMTALALGGATFIAALNLTTSLNTTMDGQSDALRHDVAVSLARPYPIAQVTAAIGGRPEVANIETWLSTPISVGAAPTAAFTPTLYGMPVETPMLALPVLSGRWLQSGEARSVVVSHTLAEAFPALRVGSDVQLRVGGKLDSWHVVGIVRQVAAPPTAWTSYDDLAAAMGGAGTTNALRIMTTRQDAESQTVARRVLDDSLTSAGIDITANQSTVEAQKVLRDHILVIATFLGLMTLLSVVIGGLGLGTTMAINVIERTREIGILRAVGATNRALLTLVVVEGSIVGALSWIVSLILAVPASIVFGRIIGDVMLETPLDFAVNPWGPVAWLAIIVVFSGLASLAPAQRAAALTVRDTLSYQ